MPGSPEASMGELVETFSIVEIAARAAAFIFIVCFGIFLRALWAPKVIAAETLNVQRLQPVAAIHKRKGGRAKKNKKSRNTSAPKFLQDTEAISEEDSSVEKSHSSSDLEAAACYDGVENSDTATSETLDAAHDIEMRSDSVVSGSDALPALTSSTFEVDSAAKMDFCKLDSSGGGTEDDSEPREINQVVQDPRDDGPAKRKPCCEVQASNIDASLQTARNADSFCEVCANPDVYFWGCAAHRSYTSALLLMHKDRRYLAQSQGPPGLDLPVVKICTTKRGLTLQTPH